MSSSGIVFDQVSKFYRLGHDQGSLRYVIPRWLSKIRGSNARRADTEGIWALNDVSFEVKPGESLGIIGPNGAGKTTILRLLSRITAPTKGNIRRNGRISALLELGAGFHPELTGRENIYLNGTILGLTRAQISARFDEIVDFAELPDFIDVPVKRYSSGMYARLGFAVAAHTEPDVLVIDEVLSVGDAHFQMKSFKKMQEFLRKGKSIVFVSHNLYAVVSICSKVLLLNKGVVVAAGDAESVVQEYRVGGSLSDGQTYFVQGDEIRWSQPMGSGEIEIRKVAVMNANGVEQSSFSIGERMTVRIDYYAKQRVERPLFGVAIVRPDDLKVFACNSSHTSFEIPFVEGAGSAYLDFSALNLQPADYRMSAAIMEGGPMAFYDHHMRAYSFKVVGKPIGDGAFHLEHRWRLSPGR